MSTNDDKLTTDLIKELQSWLAIRTAIFCTGFDEINDHRIKENVRCTNGLIQVLEKHNVQVPTYLKPQLPA